jgi:hypothetical protein
MKLERKAMDNETMSLVIIPEEGDRVILKDAPIGFRSYFEEHKLDGIGLVCDVNSVNHSFYVKINGHEIYMYAEEVSKLLFLPKITDKKLPDLKIRVSEQLTGPEIQLYEKEGDEMIGISYEGDRITLELFDTQNYIVKSLPPIGFAKGRFELISKK